MQTDTSKHTPGPWRVGDELGVVICDTMNDTTYHSPSELAAYGGALIAESIRHAANAWLIVAAPELLEACLHAEEYLLASAISRRSAADFAGENRALVMATELRLVIDKALKGTKS